MGRRWCSSGNGQNGLVIAVCGTGAGQTDDCTYKSINGKTTKRKQQNKQRKTIQLMEVNRGRGGHTKVAARARLPPKWLYTRRNW